MSSSKLVALMGHKVEVPDDVAIAASEQAKARMAAREAAEVHHIRTVERFELEQVGRRGEYLAHRDGALFEVFTPETTGVAVPGRSLSDADACSRPATAGQCS
jgi:hypothetical protein